MAKVLAFFAEGTEEIECLTVVDILRRGGVDVDLVSITKNKEVCGSHKIRVVCDKTIDDADLDSAELLFLPGGIPGVPHLEENQIVIHALKAQKEAGKKLAAICAAPSILGHLGFLSDLPFTCYPSFQEGIDGTRCRSDEADHHRARNGCRGRLCPRCSGTAGRKRSR